MALRVETPWRSRADLPVRCRACKDEWPQFELKDRTACSEDIQGPLAHRVEQGTFNPKVPGSSPGRPTIEIAGQTMFLELVIPEW